MPNAVLIIFGVLALPDLGGPAARLLTSCRLRFQGAAEVVDLSQVIA
jgi:hypothetical protein